MGYIYKIVNSVNDKAYIGMTRFDVKKRWKEHKSAYYTKDTHLYYAMRKYGIDKFNIQIIEECSDEELILKEAYWIQYYDSYKNGYNMTEGKGEGNGTSFNARPIKQYSLDGIFITEYKSCGEAAAITGIQSANIQRAARGDCNSAGNYQWRFSNDDRLVTAIKQHISGGQGKPVLQYDSSWILVGEYPSNRQAAAAIGKKDQTLPRNWFKDNKLHCGYYWRYKNDVSILQN